MVTMIAMLFHPLLMHHPFLILQSPISIPHFLLSLVHSKFSILHQSPFPIPYSFFCFFETLIPVDCNVHYS